MLNWFTIHNKHDITRVTMRYFCRGAPKDMELPRGYPCIMVFANDGQRDEYDYVYSEDVLDGGIRNDASLEIDITG